jgi:hypothetical protein
VEPRLEDFDWAVNYPWRWIHVRRSWQEKEMSAKKIAQIHWKTFAGRYIIERALEVGMLACPQTLKAKLKTGEVEQTA